MSHIRRIIVLSRHSLYWLGTRPVLKLVLLPKYYDYDNGLWIEERTIHGAGLNCFAIRQSGS